MEWLESLPLARLRWYSEKLMNTLKEEQKQQEQAMKNQRAKTRRR
jgi:hypothetical protein